MLSDLNLLEELRALVTRKKSKQFYAEKLGVTVTEVEALMQELREQTPVYDPASSYGCQINNNLDKGTIEVSTYYAQPPTPEQVIADHKIDTKQYKLSNYWSKQKSDGWQVSALFTKLPSTEEFTNKFAEFLTTYTPQNQVGIMYNVGTQSPLPNGCLILNKQDQHINKYDTLGNNDITDRFNEIFTATEGAVNKAKITNRLEKIIYVVGGDQFNSEWTNLTTKGTPQENILPYHVSFQAICDHETKVIDMLLLHAMEVEVVYVPGNHDQYVGFHMVSWLKVYYRNQYNLSVDIAPDFTKYRQYSNTAMCFNHGDVQKPAMLAQNFPVAFKQGWATSDHYAIFTGDKHVELSKAIGAIKFYQIPALSKAKSQWDMKNGYSTTPAEMTSFLITEGKGITSIFKEVL